MGGKVPKVAIIYHNPPTTGRITIERLIHHPVWGAATIQRVVGPNTGLLSSNEAAAFLGVSLVWLYHLVKQGALKTQRKKGRLVFSYRELRRLREQREAKQKNKQEELWLTEQGKN